MLVTWQTRWSAVIGRIHRTALRLLSEIHVVCFTCRQSDRLSERSARLDRERIEAAECWALRRSILEQFDCNHDLHSSDPAETGDIAVRGEGARNRRGHSIPLLQKAGDGIRGRSAGVAVIGSQHGSDDDAKEGVNRMEKRRKASSDRPGSEAGEWPEQPEERASRRIRVSEAEGQR